MRGSIRLFKVLGISVNIHVTFLLLPLFFLIYGGLKSMVLVLIIFAFVALHELTHSVVAMRFGVNVRDITLLPIGGVASMSKMPENPRHELLISVAGPMFNIVFASVLFFIFYHAEWMPEAVWRRPLSGNTWLHTIAMVPWVNVTLAGFNLLPAFPMDGGRILRDILAGRMSYGRATRIAANIGRLFAILFGYMGFTNGNFFLILIAIFVYTAASAEENHVNLRESLKGLKVKDVLKGEFLTLNTDTPVSRAMELIFRSRQEDFPVMDSDKMAGFVTRADIIAAAHKYGPAKRASEIMRADVPLVGPEDELSRIQDVMEENQIKALPVARDSVIIGVITLEDIARAYAIMARR